MVVVTGIKVVRIINLERETMSSVVYAYIIYDW